MKQFLFASIILCISLCGFAQSVPQYYYAPQFDDSTLGHQFTPFGISFSQSFGNPIYNTKDILIYYPKNFKNPPKGKITALYFWMHEGATTNPTGKFIFSDFYVKLGTTTRDSFGYDAVKKGYKLFDSEKELTTVIQGKPYTIADTNVVSYQCRKRWLKLPLQIPFMYDPNKNLVLQLLSDNNSTKSTDSNLQQFISAFGYPDSSSLNKKRFLSCLDTAKTFIFTGSQLVTNNMISSFGFDLDTTGVSGVEELQTTSLQLYPNPTKGYLYLSSTPRPNTAYTITDITGRQLLQGVVKDNSISVQSLQPGLYLLRIGTEVLRFVKEE